MAARQLGLRVRNLRKAREWTLEQASEQIGIELTHLQQIEAGKINVTLATLLRVADGLDTHAVSLFEAPNAPGRTRSGRVFHPGAEQRRGTNLKGGSGPHANPLPFELQDPAIVVQAVGKAIAARRKGAGMTQKSLAAKTGISLKYLQRVEAGTENLTLTSLVRFANSLEVDVFVLLFSS